MVQASTQGRDTRLTCLVTIHGIGFQEPPSAVVPGYADGLHANLHTALPGRLGDDPLRQAYQSGDSVPIYVRSRWPVHGGSFEEGLMRLGRWTKPGVTLDI